MLHPSTDVSAVIPVKCFAIVNKRHDHWTGIRCLSWDPYWGDMMERYGRTNRRRGPTQIIVPRFSQRGRVRDRRAWAREKMSLGHIASSKEIFFRALSCFAIGQDGAWHRWASTRSLAKSINLSKRNPNTGPTSLSSRVYVKYHLQLCWWKDKPYYTVEHFQLTFW